MADKEQFELLMHDVDAWNNWRAENPKLKPDLAYTVMRGANLRLANTEQSLFISEIDFDVPALEVRFNDSVCFHGRVSADQKRGLAVQQF